MLPDLKDLIQSGKILVMAHRGDQSSAPENSLLSFRNAAREGIDFIESDVRQTCDGELVLFHDEILDRTTSAKGKISDYTLENLKKIDLGESFIGKSDDYRPRREMSILTVGEVLSEFPDRYFNLDIKDADPSVPLKLGKIIKSCGMEKNVIIASFEPAQIYRFRKMFPEILTAAVRNEIRLFIIGIKTGLLPLIMLFLKNRFSVFQVPETSGRTRIITGKFIEAARRYRLPVHVWTVNETADMIKLKNIKVNGIFTDYPERLEAVLKG